ncbi:MAG TPA: hypothetical protein VMM56_07210 [Planctomycetaceae bacterium]|nr:hypothetical protein [Planctomycetaceae bacterium]
MRFNLTGICCVACLLAVGCEGMITPVQEEVKKQAAEEAEQAKAEEQPKKDPKGILNKTTAQVVDAKKALAENPDLVVVENGKFGTNYLTGLANVRVMVASQVSTLGMQQAVQAHQAEHGRWPTYDEFMGIMKQYGIRFTEVFAWQKYGYNEDDGTIVLFTDEALKKKIYEEKGLDYEKAGLK